MDAEFRDAQIAEREVRRGRLSGWAEWAAWRWSRGDIRQQDIGAALGGVLATEVSAAVKDYLFVHTAARFWLDMRSWHGKSGWWSIDIANEKRKALLREHFGEREPGFPGLVVRKRPRGVDNRVRDALIRKLRQEGRTLASLAAGFGICKQRVRQICRAADRREVAA